jgi:hypothetical protein
MNPPEDKKDGASQHSTPNLPGKGLGPVAMARLLRTTQTSGGDYTRDRHKWQDGLTVDEILKESETVSAPTPLVRPLVKNAS